VIPDQTRIITHTKDNQNEKQRDWTTFCFTSLNWHPYMPIVLSIYKWFSARDANVSIYAWEAYS